MGGAGMVYRSSRVLADSSEGKCSKVCSKLRADLSTLTPLNGEAALQGGIIAGEYASGAALAKFVYDGATFLYGYFGECQ